MKYLDRSAEMIYVSERDGWRHLYLVDASAGKLLKQITKGRWVIRGVDRMDEQSRQIWFRCSGLYPGQDPYLIHFCRVNFDGSGLVKLTAGNGNHSIQFSPDRRFLIDTYTVSICRPCTSCAVFPMANSCAHWKRPTCRN